ncbi:methionine adenosyltransferase [Mycoplasma todarodis]|uniref:S-adenosylmethionine synthase n=2 Tax=Mycoplasma todarodis TaxID=1937191 RepID=A0A4V2NI55_9MOLU|nr:methionine adenosyltransferase [Mycoplasma todarodis]
MMLKKLFTSESVGAGHPDKICDQISDAVLDECLKQDPESRVACEVMASNRLIIIGGEITTKAYVDVVQAAWSVLSKLGYSENDFTVISNVNSQSPDINQGVDRAEGAIGAGDQGIMFGYATNETPELMPLPITLAHALVKRAETLRLKDEFKWAKSDIKAQVTIDYTSEKPIIDTVLMSVQHTEDYDKDLFREFIIENIMKEVARQYKMNEDFTTLVNPTGKFVIGGPIGDTGLTGRKIIVDTYGGMGRHGGGAFSGKDYTKVDRSAAYAARWVAKNIVAAKLAEKAEIQLSYAIGVEQPVSLSLETFGTEKVEKDKILEAVQKVFDLSPRGIIESLKLKTPIYKKTSVFGHFGRTDYEFEWEKTNKINELKKYF